jgi:hypothetical protein
MMARAHADNTACHGRHHLFDVLHAAVRTLSQRVKAAHHHAVLILPVGPAVVVMAAV